MNKYSELSKFVGNLSMLPENGFGSRIRLLRKEGNFYHERNHFSRY